MSPQKLLPLGGIVFVALIASGVTFGGSTPSPDASAAKVASYYNAHDRAQMVAALLLAAGALFLVFFVAAAASASWPSNGDQPLWQLVLLAGGAATAAAMLGGALVHFGLADGASDLSPSALQVLNVLDGDIWVAFNGALGVMMLGAAGSLATAGVGRRLVWPAAVLGILLFIPFASFFALLLSGVWVIVTGIVLSRRSGTPTSARPRSTRVTEPASA